MLFYDVKPIGLRDIRVPSIVIPLAHKTCCCTVEFAIVKLRSGKVRIGSRELRGWDIILPGLPFIVRLHRKVPLWLKFSTDPVLGKAKTAFDKADMPDQGQFTVLQVPIRENEHIAIVQWRGGVAEQKEMLFTTREIVKLGWGNGYAMLHSLFLSIVVCDSVSSNASL